MSVAVGGDGGGGQGSPCMLGQPKTQTHRLHTLVAAVVVAMMMMIAMTMMRLLK